MADDERHDSDETDSSLELPSLRSAFRRRRRPAPAAESAPDDSAVVPPAGPIEGPELSPGPVGLPETQPEVATTVVTEDAPAPSRQRRSFRLRVPGPVAAVLTGAIVGLALVGLTSASLHLCTSMRGTPSCGTPGVLVLLVITVAVVFLGSLLLRLADVDTHGSTSFLGVGLLVVLVLIALLPVLDDWWMVIAVPVLAMLTFLAAWWLTTTYVEPGDRPR